MIKQLSILVWSAFVIWMAIFLISLGTAQAATQTPWSGTYEKALTEYSEFLCSRLTNKVISETLPGNVVGLFHKFGDEAECLKATSKRIQDAKNNNNLPTKATDLRRFSESLTLLACTTPKDGMSWDTRRSKCFQAADALLSASKTHGFHQFCTDYYFSNGYKEVNGTKSREIKSARCYQEEFEDDLFWSRKKPSLDLENGEELKHFGMNLCNWNGKDDSLATLEGLSVSYGTKNECAKTLLYDLEEAAKNRQMPSNPNEMALYKHALVAHLCTLPQPQSDTHWGLSWGYKRYACFETAEALLAPQAYRECRAADPQTQAAVRAGRVARSGLPSFEAGADCYQKKFREAQDKLNNIRLGHVTGEQNRSSGVAAEK